MVLLPYILALIAAFLTAMMWKNGDKWWQTALVFAFCYIGLVALLVGIALITTL